jgi:hypothetical protein
LSSGWAVPVRDIKKEAGGGCRTYSKVEDATRGSQHKKAWKEDGVGHSLDCKYFIRDGIDSFLLKSYRVISVCKFYRTLLIRFNYFSINPENL